MKKQKPFFLSMCIVALMVITQIPGLAQIDSDNIIVGKRDKFFSKILNEERTLEVSLPDGYENSNTKYPVLFVLDGGDLFRYCVSVVRMIAPNYFPHMIVIGIPNTNRNRDLDPNNKELSPPDKSANRFLDVLKKELIPFVENKYRTMPFRLLTGHSLAGFFTVHTLLTAPEMFKAYIATSPSMVIPDDDDYIIKSESIMKKAGHSDTFLYFSVGDKEGERIKAGTQKFLEALKRLASAAPRWKYELLTNEGHIPMKGFYNGMKEFYADWLLPMELAEDPDLQIIEGHYEKLSMRFGYKISAPEELINNLGYAMIRHNKLDRAIELFAYNVKLKPNSWNAYDSLGEAYMLKGEKGKAIKNYEKSVELNPRNNNGISMLNKLKEKED